VVDRSRSSLTRRVLIKIGESFVATGYVFCFTARVADEIG
jgi:hypothetical protein